MTPIKAVLFDHDGTLANSEVVHFQFWRDVLADRGVGFLEDDYRLHFTGVSELNTAIAIKTRFGLTDSVENLVAAKRAQAKQFHATQVYPLMPGVEEVLLALQGLGIRMAVVSGSARFALEANLTGLGLGQFFECIASGEEVANNKPAPDVYQQALTVMGLKADACIAVEDTASGLRAAVAAGIRTCVIPNDYSAHHDFSGASHRVENLLEFLLWFRRHCC
ncbi:HAD family phosphatase [Simiduia curdlanivorans]|uniref:HAD family hydrolase n=1 Tax=Simiduia curdlanivorans TaxID=1492769 RepID=A0ABV8V271_9GAMM|nr:HAD family phosphatase [Simiduia curdlanivorans]MDN3640089.1 HAD family phosphatase [Simiduia curdlanivorans]